MILQTILPTLSLSQQISHKLLLHALTSLKAGVKSGTMEHKGNGDCEGMVAALVEMASFCDRQLRLKEDEGDFVTEGLQIHAVTALGCSLNLQICQSSHL